MRKLYLVLSCVLLACSVSFSQSPVPRITQNYFRSDPFQSEFSSFLTHLMNDPTLTDKIIEKRTDTSLFYFQGTYTHHNPFFFTAKKTQVILSEITVDLDSLHTDTIYSYQLLSFVDYTNEGRELKKEFDKIYKRYKGGFSKNTLTEGPASGLNMATYNFYDLMHAIAPFALSWIGPDVNKEMCLMLTIRLGIHNNKAILPAPFYAL